jgi:hypothetical protein
MTATGRRIFDSTIPTVLQPDQFSCSISSATWCARSVGIDVAEPTMREIMLPGLVSEELGLLDGSGAGMARMFRERFGLRAQHQQIISFDEAAARAGKQPLALGGHRWSPHGGHWVAVRRFGNGELILANPGGTGPIFGQQRLDRAAFNQRAPFSAVWIEVDGVEDGAAAGSGAAVGSGGAASGLPTVPPVAEIPFEPEARFRVARTEGHGVIVRERPFQQGGRRDGALDGDVLEGAEHAWRLVRAQNGAVGWVASAYLDREGDRFRVARTEGSGVLVRPHPYREGQENLGGALDGDLLIGIEENAFRLVRTARGTVGWAPDAYLDRLDEGSGESASGERIVMRFTAADGEWTPEIGSACASENYWDPDGQPSRRAAMERFNRLPRERRRAIFEQAMEDGLSAEGILNGGERERWKRAMRSVTIGEGFPGECPDLNPFMLAGESGGVFRGGADPAFGGLNSSALGYFQFLSQDPIPPGQPFSPAFDYGHWRRFGPFPDDYGRQTEPVSQVRQFIRAIRGGKHHGDPMSVVREKASGDHTWGP